MKLYAFIDSGSPCVGVETENGIVNLTALGFPSLMSEIIAG